MRHFNIMKNFGQWGGGSFDQALSGFSTDIGWSLGLNVVWQSGGSIKEKQEV